MASRTTLFPPSRMAKDPLLVVFGLPQIFPDRFPFDRVPAQVFEVLNVRIAILIDGAPCAD